MRDNHYNYAKALVSDFAASFNRFRNTTYMIFQYLVYGALGWLVETSYIYSIHDHFSRRGLINHGLPFIPLFGYGGLLIVSILKRWKHRPIMLYILSVLLASAIELFTALTNIYFFDRRSWSYSGMPFSYRGYIALPVSLAWGALIVFIIYIFEPYLYNIFARSGPLMTGIVWALSCACVYCHCCDFLILLIK